MKLVEDPVEQTTAATDIALALVAFGGVALLQSTRFNAGQLWRLNIWSSALGLIGLAAALGAAAHGLHLRTTLHNRTWLVLNMALALAVSLFVIGVCNDLWGSETSRQAFPLIVALGLGFYLVTLVYPGSFFVFILFEALALSFASGAYVYLTFIGEPGAGFMASGVLISMAAAGLQAKKSIAFTLIWKFDHNGIYHIVQAVGLLFLIAGLLRMTISD